MARSENQGLQIAVIIFAFLTIALSVATFYFFNDASTQYANALDLQQKSTEKDNANRTLLDDKRALIEVIGMTGDVRISDVQAKRDETWTSLAGLQLPPNSKNFLALCTGLKTTLEAGNQERQDQKKKIAELEQQLKALEAKYDADVMKTAASYKAENDRLIGQNAAMAAKEQEHVVQLKNATEALGKKQEELTKLTDDMTKALAIKDKEMDKLKAEMKIVIQERYERENEVFERPDGMIVSVNAKEQTVNINRGRADFLRLNIRFGVFKRGETNVFNRTRKGTIMVTHFIGDDLAVARIVDSDLKDPILGGDVVATPTWTPGTQETFVLAGDFDVNGDRKPDNDMMRNLVDLNGGKVEEELGVTTRYLLLGDAPPAADAENRKKYDAKLQRAKELGIKRMGLTEFIEYTGSHDLIAELKKFGSKEDTKKIFNIGRRELGKNGSGKAAGEEQPRRNQPGVPRAQASDEGAKKALPPRRPGGIQ
jgi:hypothetical protein